MSNHLKPPNAEHLRVDLEEFIENTRHYDLILYTGIAIIITEKGIDRYLVVKPTDNGGDFASFRPNFPFYPRHPNKG